MSNLLTKPCARFAAAIVLFSLIAIRSGAQVTLPSPGPTPASGATINGLTVNGTVDLGTRKLTVNVPGGANGVTVTSAGNLTASSLSVVGNGGGDGTQVQVMGTATLTDTVVTLNAGGSSTGIAVSGSGANVTLTGAGSLISQANSSGSNVGALVVNGAMISLEGGASVDLHSGGSSTALQASAGTFDMTGGSLTITGAPSGSNIGVQAASGADVPMTGGSVSVTAPSSVGLQANGPSSTLSTDNATIAVTGINGIGVQAQNGGFISLTNGTTVTVGGTNFTNPIGVQLNNIGTISMIGGSVETTGTGGEAILVSGFGPNMGTFDGTSVTSDSGTGILAQGIANSTLNFLNGASLTGGDGVLLQDQASGTLNLNGINDVLFVGSIDASGASGTANVTLQFNSSLTGAINQNQLTGAVGIEPAEPITNLPRQNANLSIDGNSHWSMTASSTLNALTVNPGARVTFVDPPSDQPFKTLVMNKLVGTGATFGMNIDLGQIRGDLVAILTSSQGLHLIEFSNRDQSEDLPVNVALLVVKTADGGAGFSGETDGGTFKYFVVHGVDGSTVTPVKQNWYLVRADEIPPPQVTPPPPVDPNPTPPPPKPPGEFTPGEVGPPPEVVVPPIALSPINALTNTANAAIGTYSSTIPVYYADMQTLVERMGELRLGVQTTPGQAPVTSEQLPEGKGVVASKQVAPVPAPPPSSEWGVWVRGFGSGMRINNDASRVFDQNVGGFQIGADKRFGSLWGGDVYLGVFGGYIYASRDFRDGGDGSTNALSLGGYATWIHPKGWYVDMVGKYTQMWNYFNTPTLEGSISTGYYNIPTFGGSLEIGKRFEFASGRFFIEPEAQLAGVWENGMNYTASDGLRVHGNDQTSLRGRLGGRVGMHFDLAQGRAIEPYVRAEAIEEFLTGNTVTTDSTNLDSHLSGTVGRFGGGLTAKLSQSVYIYGEYDYATGDHIEQPWSISAGLRWQW